MLKQFGNGAVAEIFDRARAADVSVTRSGQLGALIALEQIGARRSFGRHAEIYAEGDRSDCWFKVISGTVRICKLMADGRRHIAEFFTLAIALVSMTRASGSSRQRRSTM